MSNHGHDHNHGHHHDHNHPHEAKPKRGLHKDWRVWAIVGLMILCMLVYILTLDESFR